MISKKEETNDLTRREFIKRTSASALGISLLGGLPESIKASLLKSNVISKSKVVLVRNPNVITQNGEVNHTILKEMLNKALTNFSGVSPAAYWQKLFSPNDTIGLKVNTLGLSNISRSSLTKHFDAVTSAIIESCKEAGFNEENFIIWDRSNEELISAGYTIQKEKGKTRVLGVLESRRGGDNSIFHEKEYLLGNKTTRITKILTDQCTGIINIPLIKDHGSSGFTGALKNHYGTINNAREFHSNNCTNPGIPEVNMIDVIRNKQRLIISDALLSVFNGGPRWERRFTWAYGGILVGTDPVAIDTVMFNILNEKRVSEGLSAISDNIARHIHLSKEIGLGTNDINEIDFVEINLGQS